MTNQIIPVDCFLSNDEIQALQEMQKVKWSKFYVISDSLKYFEKPKDLTNNIYSTSYPHVKSEDNREFAVYASDSEVEELQEVTRLGASVTCAGEMDKIKYVTYVEVENYPDNLQLGKFFGVYNKLFIVRTVSDEYYVFDGPQYEMHLDEHLLIENPQGERMLISVSIETAMVDITTDDSIIEKILAEPGSVIPVDDL